MSELDANIFPVAGPVVYVLSLGTGVIKVGFTTQPRYRLATHARHARQMGTKVVTSWCSPLHKNIRENEQRLIDHCVTSGGKRVGDGEASEYFSGLDFHQVCAFARTLPFLSPPPPKEEASHSGRSESCVCCGVSDERPLTAFSVLLLVAHGQLRLVDPSGRDVSANWAGTFGKLPVQAEDCTFPKHY